MDKEQKSKFKLIVAKYGFLTFSDLAVFLNMTPSSLSLKLSGKRDFTIPEINFIRKEFHLTNEEVMEFFFGEGLKKVD